ncbi:MAG: hypothetical protein A2X82_17650 [Geobacteraceae bacterium GWC2_55_20]|nr:MAG: hypothetical protein A2X82_17650 [Geobacteraceae bacterium GWC2_55_20]OGU22438.1 MAG: hypothetical protein A2X85_17570 [Geobacteraceae bacterium GWF2_54_21]HBA71220.1 hypothetical protein [Geobacter sp.]HCE69352.1 hypothetical protein [Geobacter sp.]
MKQIYEAWDDPDNDCVSVGTVESITDQMKKGIISSRAFFLHRVEADTWEDAMTKHHEIMSFAPYVPMGNREKCPNGCGSEYYPEGSGQCPYCGKIE